MCATFLWMAGAVLGHQDHFPAGVAGPVSWKRWFFSCPAVWFTFPPVMNDFSSALVPKSYFSPAFPQIALHLPFFCLISCSPHPLLFCVCSGEPAEGRALCKGGWQREVCLLLLARPAVHREWEGHVSSDDSGAGWRKGSPGTSWGVLHQTWESWPSMCRLVP